MRITRLVAYAEVKGRFNNIWLNTGVGFNRSSHLFKRCANCFQTHPTTVFCEISVPRSKNYLEFSIA